MSPQRIILVLADRSTEAQSSLHKASVLARHLDASIDIFLCDTDHAWAVREQAHSNEARAVVMGVPDYFCARAKPEPACCSAAWGG